MKNKQAALQVLGQKPDTFHEALKMVTTYIANTNVLETIRNKQVTSMENAVTISHNDESLKQLGDTIIQGIESLLKEHSGKTEGSRYRSPIIVVVIIQVKGQR